MAQARLGLHRSSISKMAWASSATCRMNCLKSYIIKDNYFFVCLSLFYLPFSDLSP